MFLIKEKLLCKIPHCTNVIVVVVLVVVVPVPIVEIEFVCVVIVGSVLGRRPDKADFYDSDASICTRIGIPDVKATFGRAILFAFFVPVNLPLLHKSWLALQSLNLANSGSYCLNFSMQ